MIAAGEIVERPASVVKELVENSLDAGATEVSIEIRAGGIEHIRVADNGVGIAADEAEVAFERFATSKLSGPSDLDAIATLGFRGEALPSIASVSSVSLVTRAAPEDTGTRLDVADGEIARRPEGAAPGTSVVVRHLFRNFPARLKFLRSAATEASRVQTLATRYALAYPQVRVQMSIDGKTAFASSGSGELREVFADLYNVDVAGAMLELTSDPDRSEDDLPVPSGLIGPPSLTRSNRSHVSIFVNGRWVQNRMLGYAFEEAYRGFIMERRYPMAVVNMALPHHEVDVNVHPSKTEVRFRHEGKAFSALQRAARYTLTTHSPVPELQQQPVSAPHVASMAPPPGLRSRSATTPAERHGLAAAVAPDAAGPLAPDGQPDLQQPISPLIPHKALPALRVLGQVQSTYIAAEGPDGVYLIDQHAAHERVVFERVMADAASRSPQVQMLMEPVTVELDPRQGEMLESHLEPIAQAGFQIEGFGGRTYILRGVPGLLVDGDPGQNLLDVLDLMADGGGFESWEERAAYSIACHGAIRAGETLSTQEMFELTRQLEECQQPHTCPHGRPTMVHMSSARLEREFGRR